MAIATQEEIIEAVEKLSVLELSELVKKFEDKFGVSAAAPVSFAGAVMPGAGGGAQVAEEQTEFSVVLKEAGPNKIQVIKEVRAITSLGLKEAKDLVDGAPKNVVEGQPKDKAEEIQKKLQAVGATAEIK